MLEKEPRALCMVGKCSPNLGHLFSPVNFACFIYLIEREVWMLAHACNPSTQKVEIKVQSQSHYIEQV